MLALGVRYLNGWAMATHPANRTRAEWPPHPDRLFMALVAAHHETRDEPPPQEQLDEEAALSLLERLGAPLIWVSRHDERTPVTTYVPVNDKSSPINEMGKAHMVSGALAIGRERKPREFPVAIPEDPVVFFLWPDAQLPDRAVAALDALCAKVTYVGHSASMVQMWRAESQPPAGAHADTHRLLQPVSGRSTRYRLRVPGPGRLQDLRESFAAAMRPTPALWQGYDEEQPELEEPVSPSTCFATDVVILRAIPGRRLGLDVTVRATHALRETMMSMTPDPVPEWVCGHRPDGRPTEEDHVALVPLPHVGREHADGHLLGLGIVLPRRVPAAERSAWLRLLLYDDLGQAKRLELRLGRLGSWGLELDQRAERPLALLPETWTAAPPAQPARRWASVTPVVLDRYPKRDCDAEEIVSSGCERIGLPRPADVVISSVSMFPGSPHARAFTPLPTRSEGAPRFHTHVILAFPEPVAGPVLIGAGRYRGYGLCRPLRGPRL